MATKKVSEARTKYAVKAKRALTSNRATRPDLAKSVEALNQNVLELQSKLDEVNRRLAAFEFRSDAPHLSLEEKRERVDRLCGVWADDHSLKAIFAELEQQRAWSRLAEQSFAFWDNETDAIYDTR
jgi:chromosome segregation ATPase